MLLNFLFSLLFVAPSAYATETDPYSMNGYKLKDFKGFEKKWNFVTVRYREDTGEMRFTYANPLAWKSLNENVKVYPDGAVFGKVSIRTKKDLDFPSSTVPTGARRVQFMVRNSKRHSQTGGWGYALFNSNGKRFEGNVTSKSMACAACHAIVSSKGGVFSRPMQVGAFSPHLKSSSVGEWKSKLKFKTVSRATLKGRVRKLIDEPQVRILTGEMVNNVFFGTLDEIRPLLIDEFLRTRKPSALISKDGSKFSLVLPEKTRTCAKPEEVAMKAVHTLEGGKKPEYTIDLCVPSGVKK